MGIKLDWEIEAEQSRLRATEDPRARRRRRQARQRLIVLIALIVLVGAGAVAAARWRLDQVDSRLRQDLIDTVAVEVAALRVGDFANFISIQRSASDAFMLEQSRLFDEYQSLKQTHRVQLTGQVRDIAIEDRTGRVVVEEIIDGVPYHVVWFYWYYEDGSTSGQAGWRRVPENLTFWGEARTINTPDLEIQYNALDETLAQGLAPRVQTWWTNGCRILACLNNTPAITLEIIPRRPSTVNWSAYDAWTLEITSPLVGRARADTPVAPEMERAVTEQLARRLVRLAAGDLPPVSTADAAWLYDELARWLGDRMLYGESVPSPLPGFTESLIDLYGPSAPVTLARTLQPATSLHDVFMALAGVPTDQVSPDVLNAFRWTDFFTWRLTLEQRLLNQSDSASMFLTLYDMNSTDAASEAHIRLDSPAYAARPVPDVQRVTITRQGAELIALVDVTRPDNAQSAPETLRWRYSGGTWKRVS